MKSTKTQVVIYLTPGSEYQKEFMEKMLRVMIEALRIQTSRMHKKNKVDATWIREENNTQSIERDNQ